MKVILSYLASFAVCLALMSMGGEAQDADADRFCAVAPFDALCPEFPYDQPEFARNFEYMIVAKGVQSPFDAFGWKAFTALNWQDYSGKAGPDQWQDFMRADKVVGRDPAGAQCANAPGPLRFTDIRQADGTVLIAQNGQPVVYETRINATAADYLARASTLDINFPRGGTPDMRPSVHLKSAWIMLQDDDPNFITARGAIYIAPSGSATGEALCIEGLFGLIGLHIVAKVASGNGDEWIWSTFEHKNTAPTSSAARKINSVFSKTLFAEGCPVDNTVVSRRSQPLLYDPDCPDCVLNMPYSDVLIWHENWPHARGPKGAKLPASQVTRCWEIFEPTQNTNAKWQQKLAGTVLENYQLISAQWRGAQKNPLFEHGELPRYVSNVTMESFLQTEGQGTCLGCHAGALTSDSQPADFAFYLRDF
ncbi:hypothetical protein EDD53_2059 [Pacificibacter maritimus]|uniref:Cytochrome P460 n=1 Tax=Pacificibacter maritimus TaxID=762213 RepID=A0A3N4UMS7_9RHOB|nr:hypothetical protein [Pacificibacter maritimus]RPE66357.1 hypothetical protein EDD53_2059 [Pacificibacter maritimus]